jgi:hypothetical protein
VANCGGGDIAKCELSNVPATPTIIGILRNVINNVLHLAHLFLLLAADLKVFWEILQPFLPWSSNTIYSSAPLVQQGGCKPIFPNQTYMKLWSLEVMMISSSSSKASSVIVLTPDLSSSSSFPFGRI